MKILVTGAWKGASEYLEIIKKKGHQVLFLQNEKDELPCDYGWVEGIIGNGIFLAHSIEKFINLRYIQLTSAGYDRVPMDYVRNHGIRIYNAGGVYSIPMAEYAVAGVLSLYKGQMFFAENQKGHKWVKKRDLKELYGQKVCIFGCGSVGSECAKRLEAFGCLVFGVGRVAREQPYFSRVYRIENIKSILPETDIVIIALPLTAETYHMINKEIFDVMKPGAVVVNIARGSLVDTNALTEALQHKLGGAVLDVFEEEPLNENSALWNMKNVIITPHNSFIGNGNNVRLSNVIINNLEKYCHEDSGCIAEK